MSNIQWTDETWNPIVGCSRISPGCANCYAATSAQSARLQQFEQYQKVSNWNGEVAFVESQLTKPLKWRSPKKVFVCSMSDLFHENIPDEWRDEIFAVIAQCPQHIFQLLTKRPENALRYFQPNPWRRVLEIIDLRYVGEYPCLGHLIDDLEVMDSSSYLPNCWFGITVENQAMADHRIPLLLEIPAAVRWLSVEPLLDAIDLESHLCTPGYTFADADAPIDWVVVGGESGKKARTCLVEWIEDIVSQCKSFQVSVFVKQMGSNALQYDAEFPFKTSDRKNGNISESPVHLQIREFPNFQRF